VLLSQQRQAHHQSGDQAGGLHRNGAVNHHDWYTITVVAWLM